MIERPDKAAERTVLTYGEIDLKEFHEYLIKLAWALRKIDLLGGKGKPKEEEES